MTPVDQFADLMKNVVEDLKNRWDFYRHSAYLKKRGWTEEQYQRYEDSDLNVRATRIEDYYHGYAHIVVFTTTRGDPWTRYDSWIDAYAAIEEWCRDTCESKWRSDILRVIKHPGTNNKWELNDIGGGDALFFAFKTADDCFLFKLKWGGE